MCFYDVVRSCAAGNGRWGFLFAALVAAAAAALGFTELLIHHEQLLAHDSRNDEQILRGIRHGWYTATVLLLATLRAAVFVALAAEHVLQFSSPSLEDGDPIFGVNTAAAPAICLFGPLAVGGFIFSEEARPQGPLGALFSLGPFAIMGSIAYGMIPAHWAVRWSAKLLLIVGAMWKYRGAILAAIRRCLGDRQQRLSQKCEIFVVGGVGLPLVCFIMFAAEFIVGWAWSPSRTSLLGFRVVGALVGESVALLSLGRWKRLR
eukprot:SAG31_NODE_5428_length_2544_cov_2.005317_3_plen_262_part_00